MPTSIRTTSRRPSSRRPMRRVSRWLNSRRSTRLARRGLPLTLLALVVAAFSFTALAASNAIDTSNAGQETPELAGGPAIVGVAPGDVQLSVQFDPPGNVATAGITTYQYTTDNGVTWKTRAAGTTASPLVITTVSGGSTPLVNGTTYPVRIRAVNAVGAGLVSNRVDGTPRTVPGAPPLVTAAADDAHLSVEWELPLANGGSVVSGHRVQIRTSPNGAWTDPSGPCAFASTGTSTALSCDATGLTNGTDYDVRVAAVNAAGEGPYSSAAGPFTPVAATPGAPTNVLAVPENQQVTVSWSAPSDLGGLVITGYVVTSDPGGFTCSTNGALSCVVTGLTNGTAYTFTVAASTAGGPGPSSAPSGSVTPHTVPGTPTGLVATPGEQTMALTWTAPVSDGGSPLSGYTVHHRAVGATTWTSVSAASTSATITGLTVGVSYEFEVAAVNVAAGAGAFTAVVTADGSTAWRPEDLSGGLAFWFDADDATTLTLAGSNVTDWADKSGHLRSASQTTSGNRPALAAASIGSRSSVDFDGTDDVLPFTGSALAGTDYTVAVAAARGSNASGNRYLGGTATSTNANLSLGWSTNTALIHAQYGNDYTLAVTGYSGTPTAEVHVFRQSSSTGKALWRNGGGAAGAASATSADTTALSGWTGSALGRASSNHFDGGIGEVVITADALSATDRQRLEGYLAHRWGTSGSLPSDHPYKSGPPFTSTPATAPGTPTSPATSAGNQAMTVSWTAPSGNGSPVTDYVVEYKVHGAAAWTAFADGTSSTTSATVTGLTIGTTYDFRVAAVNAVGIGSWSTAATSTAVGVPGTPTALAATPGDQTMALTWTAPAANGSAITDYTVEYQVSGSGSWTTFADGTSTATNATVTGLTAGTAYDFRVAATNAIGTGSAGTAVTATAITTPGAPTALAATPGDQTMALNWTAPASNGSSALTDYTVHYRAQGAPTWTLLTRATSTTPSATVTGLTAGTTYDFQVAAVNAAGSGTTSTTVTATAITTPDAPTALAATVGDQSVALAWTAPASNGGSALTDYTVQYRIQNAATWTTFADGTSTTTSATVTGLTAGTTYDFQVAAVNAAGTGTTSTTVTATAITTPDAPTALTATPGDQSVALAWTAPTSNGSSAITDYTVQYRAQGAPTWTLLSRATSTVASATVAGLTSGTTYEFQVAAVNAAGTGTYSTIVTATAVTTPGAPTALAATVGDQSVALTWTAPTSNGSSAITDYTVHYRAQGGPTWTLLTRSASTTPSATVTGLTAGTVYEFRVAAVNAAGTGTFSSTVTATADASPAAPSGLTATAASQAATLAWTAPASNGGTALTDYVVQYRLQGAGTWSTFADGTSTTTGATVTGLTAGSTYEFQVAGSNVIGTGTYTATVTATAQYPWNPNYLSTLAMWLDADDATTFTLSGTAVSSWSDKSGNNYSAAQATTANRPVRTASVMGGRAAVVFDGTSDSLALSSTSLLNNTNYTVAAAVARTSNKSANPYLGGTASTNLGSLSLGWATDTALAASTSGTFTVAGADLSATVTAYSSAVDEIHVTSFSSTAGRNLWGQGGSVSATAAAKTSAVTSWAGAALGMHRTAYFAGRIGEFVIATSALSTSDRQILEGYLAHKWGTTAALPSDHPYKTLPPGTATAPDAPSAPTSATASVSATTATVSWTAPSSSAATVRRYTVTSSPGGLTCTTTTTTCNVTGLTGGTSYTFTVTATSGFGTGSASAASNSVTAQSAPGAPTGLTVTAFGTTSITVSWTAPASNGGSAITGYAVAVTGQGNPPDCIPSPATNTSCTITGLSSNKTYNMSVTATNAIGTGAASAAVSQKTN